MAGFDVYGNVSHQLLSRLYMDFLRIEGEMNFVGMLPEKDQQQLMNYWYRDAESHLQTYVDLYIKQVDAPNNIRYLLSSLFGEDKRRIPAEDNLTIARGVIGAYPNSFLRVNEAEIDAFITQFQQLDSEESYRVLKDKYAVRRSDPQFWAFSDKVHQLYHLAQPTEAGLLDYNRLENR